MTDAAQRPLRVVLAGNPNSGKTTLFNALTGANQQVGNYPGVTVEKKTGRRVFEGRVFEFTDLPGAYQLIALSQDEQVAREAILRDRPDVVVNVVDASNLERSLLLTTQLLELEVPVVLALNMSDAAEALGIEFDRDRLAARLGATVVPVVGHKGRGCDALLRATAAAGRSAPPPPVIHLGPELEAARARLTDLAARDAALLAHFQAATPPELLPGWLALKLLEGDREVARAAGDTLRAALDEAGAQVRAVLGDAPPALVTERRYGFISGLCQETVRNTVEFRHTLSDRADAVMTHRVLGIPIFLVIMYLMFSLTFKVGAAPMGWLEALVAWLGGAVRGAWPAAAPAWLLSLITDGILGGVGGVIVFLPNIMLLFLAIAVLEYSGYMARAAFVTDRFMHRIGLHGKSFIPLLIGFGCTVPAILATRTLDTRRDRLITMLVAPLVSCGARLPIYALLIPAFFPAAWHGFMLVAIYVIGILLAIGGAKVLGVFVFKEENEGLVMELPPYRLPTLRSLFIYMWERSWLYLRKAGTLILGVSVLMWVLATFPRLSQAPEAQDSPAARAARIEHSWAGRIGRGMEPVLRPLGFDWRVGTALIGAFAAKEVFVAQLGIVYSLGEADESSESLRQTLRRNYSPLTGFCMMLFTLIGFPCAATVAAVRAESGRWRWALLQLGGLTLLAYLVTLAVNQTGLLLARLF